MSWNPALAPGCPDEIGFDAIETLAPIRSSALARSTEWWPVVA